MRILEVLDTYFPKFDGPTKVVTDYCKCLNKIPGVKAEVCVPKFPKYKDNQEFCVFRVKSAKGPEGYYYAMPRLDRKLKKYLKENKFDIIHIHSPFTMCGFFTKYGKKHNIPTIFTFHTKFKEDFDRMLKLKITRKIAMKYIMHNINNADYVLTVSNGAGECLKEYGYKKDINVIRNGTDLAYPEDANALTNQVRELYHLKKEDLVFISVGRIVENKKLGFACEVMKELKDRGLVFKYLIVGSGPYENDLKEKVKKLGLEDFVIFTGKVMDRKVLSGHYLCANLFIFPSTFDTASLAPIEAAALKLPTIMTKGCSTAEIITDERNGLLAEENVKSWADKIYSAVKENKLEMLKENSYKEVYKTWDEIVKDVYKVYKNILKGDN